MGSNSAFLLRNRDPEFWRARALICEADLVGHCLHAEKPLFAQEYRALTPIWTAEACVPVAPRTNERCIAVPPHRLNDARRKGVLDECHAFWSSSWRRRPGAGVSGTRRRVLPLAHASRQGDQRGSDTRGD